MKKLLTLTALFGAASLSFGQGYVNFGNAVTSTTHVTTNSVSGGPATGRISGGAGVYTFALFVAPAGTAFNADLAGWTLVGHGANTASLGRFFGSTDSNGMQVPGYGISSTANFLVAGWNTGLGTTWQEVQPWYNTLNTTGVASREGWFGFSGVAQNVVLGGGAIPVPNLFGVSAGQVLGFNLNLAPVPEPTSFALAGLGAAALMIFRRRK